MSQNAQVTAVVVILAMWIIIAVLGVLFHWNVPQPPQWLDQWSRLIATVVVATVGAWVLWSAPQQLDKFLSHLRG
jgi:ABC-type nickel/cobalt efflux system permease component RcnA